MDDLQVCSRCGNLTMECDSIIEIMHCIKCGLTMKPITKGSTTYEEVN